MRRVRKPITILFVFLGILVVSGVFLVLGLVQSEPPIPPPPGPGIPPAPAPPAPITPGYIWVSALGALVGGIGSLISGTVALIVVLRKSRT